jgi:hypothetical protein
MSYLPTQSLRSPQLDINNAPIRTFALGQNALFKDFFKAPIMPNVYTTFPRAVQTANQNYIGRYMLMHETQNYDRAYQPKLENLSIPLEEVPLRNVGGIQRPMFSVY